MLAQPGTWVSAVDGSVGLPPCFDAAAAEFPTRLVRIEQVIDLLHITHAPERVDQYHQAMCQGERFPPVSVVQLGKRFLIADGHKRFAAFRRVGAATLVVEVWPLWRWWRDQWRQLRGKTVQQWTLAWHSVIDPRARPQARRLVWDTIGHWKRVLISLRSLRRRSAPD